MNIIECIKDGMHASAIQYGWVDSVWGTTEHVDRQVEAGLEKGVFPFPVFYAIRTKPNSGLKIFTVYVEKDLTKAGRSGYTDDVIRRAF